jgi:hypothetical protein
MYLLTAIHRANLDAFWTRAANTIKDNFSRHARDYEDTVKTFGLQGEDFLPQMGWPILEDTVGMALAVQALRPGKHADTIQYSTIRKTHIWYTNAYTAGKEYNTAAMFAKIERKTYITPSPASGEWFSRFKRGMKLKAQNGQDTGTEQSLHVGNRLGP